ncbi:MAG: type II secretion system F family protein [Bacteroidota bacterium]|nr:type II secretion system F family protein [Bacteroidota bacterium]
MPVQIPDSIHRPPRHREPSSSLKVNFSFADLHLPAFRKDLSIVQKERLFRELHTLLKAGVDPRSVLDLLLSAQNEGLIKRMLSKIREQVVRGESMSASLSSAGGFTEYEIQSIRIGEESGRLADVCGQLAEHHADRIKINRMIRQAFAYPLFVLFITLGVVLFMMNVVVPMFAQVFARSGSELPALTRHVLNASVIIRSWWHVFLLSCMILMGILFMIKENKKWRSIRETILLHIPVFGELRRRSQLARLSRSMAFLLGNGSPLDRALELSERMTDSPRFRSSLAEVRRQVILGSTLKEAMASHPAYDRQFVAMIGVAEEVKQLDTMFLQLSDRYTADVQHRTTLLGSVLEPATILVIAVLVGIVLVAMYLPMFKLSTTF